MGIEVVQFAFLEMKRGTLTFTFSALRYALANAANVNNIVNFEILLLVQLLYNQNLFHGD